jgi:hypothetical protein
MEVFGPVTPGQVSFLLGLFPVLIAWIYSEFLEYRRSSAPAKLHSDRNLESSENANNKEEDKAVLLEGGLSKSPSAKSRQVGNVKTSLVRLFILLKSVFRTFQICFTKLLSFLLKY